MNSENSTIGIIGGSGLYDFPGMEDLEEVMVSTPFGQPSDCLLRGTCAGRTVYFLPRHGRGHNIAPHEINHRANLYALRSENVRWLICVTAVGSLQEQYHPRDVVIPDQLFDRTSRREFHTFFANGIVAHVGFSDPYSSGLRSILVDSCKEAGVRAHDGGTYVNMDGPAFSTRAESNFNRKMGFDVIGMTNLPEAKLAREAEMACACLSMVCDYDCWKMEEEPVSAEAVTSHLGANVENARSILAAAIPKIPLLPDWPEHFALDRAILTAKKNWPPEQAENLSAVLGRFLV